MERNFNNDFESILKEHSDQYRMYPSEKVWKGIHKALHPGKRWFGLGALLLLVSGTFVTLLMIDTKDKKVGISNNPQTTQSQTGVTQNNFSESNPLESTASGALVGRDPSSYNTRQQRVSLLATQENTTDISLSQQPITTFIPELQRIGLPVYTNIADQLTDQDTYLTGTEHVNRQAFDQSPAPQTNLLPWTIESVTNIFKGKKQKVSWQVYFTPTISYRKLRENKAFIRTAAALNPASPPNYSALYDINTAVTHKPDIGLELGIAGKYAVANNLKLRAGVQFNISRYAIKAFNNPEELTTIALNNGGFGGQPYNTTSNYRNFSGEAAHWLQNFYFQVSAPVGAEVKLAGNDQVQFGVGGTVQPTYILGDRAYLITTDYKNYAEVPWLIRRWNVNTHVEAFVTYSTGKLKWQVGPQVRYQLMSSFVKKYPVKENLFDFGLKVGVSLNQNQ